MRIKMRYTNECAWPCLEASLLSPYLSGLLETDEQVMRNCRPAKGLEYLFIYLFLLPSCIKLHLACVVNPELRLHNALALQE